MSLLYLYGFVPSDASLPERGLLGVGDVPVELVRLDGFAAAVGRPDPAVYGAEPLESRTGDMAWMAEQGLRHEQVVAWFVDHAAIVPSRLLTLFSSEAALADAAGEGTRIRQDLERFSAAREWDLKVSYDPARLEGKLGEVSDEIARLDEEIADAGPGKRFLLEKKRKDVAKTEGRAIARQKAAELLDALRADAEDSVVLPAASESAPVVLNAALLVPTGSEAAVRERAAEARERLEPVGIVVAFTGPWAPYRFAGGPDA